MTKRQSQIGVIVLSLLILYLGCTKDIPPKDTVMRGKLLYQRGEKKPFTGIVSGTSREYYRSKRLTFKKEYEAGLQHGWTKYYYPNGKLERAIPYTNGKIHGLYMRYWPNGKAKARIHFENDMRGGSRGEMFWDENGRPIKKR